MSFSSQEKAHFHIDCHVTSRMQILQVERIRKKKNFLCAKTDFFLEQLQYIIKKGRINQHLSAVTVLFYEQSKTSLVALAFKKRVRFSCLQNSYNLHYQN